MTYLSTLSHYQITVVHTPGKENQFSDFLSRNPIECDGSCQICEYIEEEEESVVRAVNLADILSGKSLVPYTTRSAWNQIQRDCGDLNKVARHLREGTMPSKRIAGQKDVKRYLNKVKLSTNPAAGLLIVQEVQPLQSARQRIVVPREIVDGLVTAIHIRL